LELWLVNLRRFLETAGRSNWLRLAGLRKILKVGEDLSRTGSLKDVTSSNSRKRAARHAM